MFWKLFNRRNIIIFLFLVLIAALGVAYSRITFIKKDNDVLKANIENLEDKVKTREEKIVELDKEVKLLLEERKILEDTLKSNEEKLKQAEEMFSSIKDDFNISIEDILDDPENYVTDDLSFSFDDTNEKPIVHEQVIMVKSKPLNIKGQKKISEKTINAMWKAYCLAYGCETK